MKCPMLFIGRPLFDSAEDPGFADCISDRCTWWDPDKNCCCVRTIARSLDIVQLKMIDIVNGTAVQP